jgi:hypothetical protein
MIGITALHNLHTAAIERGLFTLPDVAIAGCSSVSGGGGAS